MKVLDSQRLLLERSDGFNAGLGSTDLTTPAFIVDEQKLVDSLVMGKEIAERASCQLLYSLKANTIHSVLELIANWVKGFGCSSLRSCQ